MKKTFLRALLLSATTQFIATRNRAGRVTEEGAAEMLWALYPLNVLFTAIVWTLLISATGCVVSIVRRAL